MSERLRLRSFLLSFLIIIIFILSIISDGTAINYGVGVKKEEELVWNCNVCNKDEMKILFGNNWDNSGFFEDLNRGSKMKWKIKNIEINDTYLVIKVELWKWNSEKNWGIKDSNFQIIYFINPKTYVNALNFSNYAFLVPFLFPIPVSEYLGNLKLNEWYDVDNRVLTTLNVEITKDQILTDYPTKDIKIIAIYNERGILTSYKLYIKENVVIVDISFNKLPYFVIPALVCLTVCLSTAVIIYILKKKQSIKKY
ncbi:MAG: hypothetical protein ACFFB0_14190 [Promethearchaeota archaeon]